GRARGVDEAVVVRPSTLAGIDPARRRGAKEALITATRRGLPRHGPARKGDTAEIDHGFLHRHADALAPPGATALIEGAQDADRAVQAPAGGGDPGTRPPRDAARLSGGRDSPADRLSDHVEGRGLGIFAVLREALDLRVDDPGIELRDSLVVEAQTLDHPGGIVLYEDIRIADKRTQDLFAPLVLQVERHAALIRVKVNEVEGVGVLPVGGGAPSLLAADGRLDLDDVGAEPGEHLGAGRAGLELREVHDANPMQSRKPVLIAGLTRPFAHLYLVL